MGHLIATGIAGALAVVASPHHLATASVAAVAGVCAVFADIHWVATAITPLKKKRLGEKAESKKKTSISL